MNFKLISYRITPPNLYANWVKVDDFKTIIDVNNKSNLDDMLLFPFDKKVHKIEYLVSKIFDSIKDSFSHEGYGSHVSPFLKNKLGKLMNEGAATWKTFYSTLTTHFVDFKPSLSKEIPDTLIDSLTKDSDYAPFAHTERFFKGIHQIVELNLLLLPELKETITNSLDKFKNQKTILESPLSEIYLSNFLETCEKLEKLAITLSSHIMHLTRMDKLSFAQYRPSLEGTSGAGSEAMRELKRFVFNLYDQLLSSLNISEEDIIENLTSRFPNSQLNDIINQTGNTCSAVHTLWSNHYIMAYSVIGSTKGTEGTTREGLRNLFEKPLTNDPFIRINTALTQHSYAQENVSEHWDSYESPSGKEKTQGHSTLKSKPQDYWLLVTKPV
jgi:hypothetical protein